MCTGKCSARRLVAVFACRWPYMWSDDRPPTAAADNLMARYTDSPGYWGGLVSQRRGIQSRFFQFDGQHVLTDETGTVTDNYVHTACGEEKG